MRKRCDEALGHPRLALRGRQRAGRDPRAISHSDDRRWLDGGRAPFTLVGAKEPGVRLPILRHEAWSPGHARDPYGPTCGAQGHPFPTAYHLRPRVIQAVVNRLDETMPRGRAHARSDASPAGLKGEAAI